MQGLKLCYKAVSLLQSYPCYNSVTKSALIAKIDTVQINIKEAKSKGNYIPEHTRIRCIKTTTNIVNRTR